MSGMEQPLVPNAARFNLRDYGGYPTSSGGRLRAGVLFRSGQLDGAGDEERALLSRLGIGVVVDLRSEHEISPTKSCAYEGFSGSILIAEREDGVIPHAIEGLAAIPTQVEAKARMEATYRLLPRSERFRQSLGLCFRALIDVEGGSLIHCFAGKDRTGLAVALVQRVLGVHHDDVMEEYLRTNQAGEERIAAGIAGLRAQSAVPLNDTVLREIMAVRPEYLAAAFAEIGSHNTDPAAWVVQATGMVGAEISALRDRYAG